MALVDEVNPYRDPDYRDAWEQGFDDGEAGGPMSTTVEPLRKALRRGYDAGQSARRPDLFTWAHSVSDLVKVAKQIADSDLGIEPANAQRLRAAAAEVEKMA